MHRSKTGEGSLQAARARTAAVGIVEEILTVLGITSFLDGTPASTLAKKHTDSYAGILTNGELIDGHAIDAFPG